MHLVRELKTTNIKQNEPQNPNFLYYVLSAAFSDIILGDYIQFYTKIFVLV